MVKNKKFLGNLYFSDHQTVHFLTGFIGEPSGQFQSSENSGMLEKGPLTLKGAGEWTPVRTLFLVDSGLLTVHHLLAPDSQNSCLCVKSRAGREGSGPSLETRLR